MEVGVGSPSGPTGPLGWESYEWTEMALLRPAECTKKPLTTDDPKHSPIQMLTRHNIAYITYTVSQVVWKVSRGHLDG
jgi:hypothetical protein